MSNLVTSTVREKEVGRWTEPGDLSSCSYPPGPARVSAMPSRSLTGGPISTSAWTGIDYNLAAVIGMPACKPQTLVLVRFRLVS
jgi:hypothetical protein